MKRIIAVIFILAGCTVGAFGLALLPGDHGRFEYIIEVVDPRPAAQSVMPEGLAALGAVRALALKPPISASKPQRVLLVAGLAGLLKASDCALGSLPTSREWQGLAGSDSGLDRGPLQLNGQEVQICGLLQELGPLWDGSLVMAASESVEEALREAGWEAQARYLLFAASWDERGKMLAKLEADTQLLPTPEAMIVSPARRPPLSRGAKLVVAVALVCAGLFVLGCQLRGLSREEVARRFGRG
jgi:hypothetical protein